MTAVALRAHQPLHKDTRWALCRSLARERDGFRCLAERMEQAGEWYRCQKRSDYAWPVYARTETGEAWADVETVFLVCNDCRRLLQRGEGEARVPLAIRRRAFDHLVRARREGRVYELPSGGRP